MWRVCLTLIRACLMARDGLIAENLALRSQLALVHGQLVARKRRKPKTTRSFRILWSLFASFWADWKEHIVLVKPETVIRWHRMGFKAYWRWKSKPKGGRPAISIEMRTLIRKLNQENPLWSPERIHAHLNLLGFDPPVPNTIRKYMRRPPSSPEHRQAWQTFLKNHMDETWAIDFFTVPTLTFRILYALSYSIIQGVRSFTSASRPIRPCNGQSINSTKLWHSTSNLDIYFVTMTVSAAMAFPTF